MSNALIIADNVTGWTVLHRFEHVVVTIEFVRPHTVDEFPELCKLLFFVVVDSVVDDIHEEFLRFFRFCPTLCCGDVDG